MKRAQRYRIFLKLDKALAYQVWVGVRSKEYKYVVRLSRDFLEVKKEKKRKWNLFLHCPVFIFRRRIMIATMIVAMAISPILRMVLMGNAFRTLIDM